MEQKLSDVLDNLLGLLLLEGSYEIEEQEEGFFVSIDTPDAGRLIGFRGESLTSLQQIINQIVGKSSEEQFKRVVVDVAGWRKQKEEELISKAKEWAKQVLESKKDFELEPMVSWQRRVIHMIISEQKGLVTESIGEGRDRHIVIKVKSEDKKSEKDSKDAEAKKD